MNYNFFADKQDKIEILEFLFQETDLQVFDSYSPSEEQIYQYKKVDEIASKYDLVNGGQFALTFQLWSPRHKGEVLFRKIELDPKHCNGNTFRYSTNGWGLIQLYFGGMQNSNLNQSHIGHFNEKGALEKESKIHFNGKVSNWDWKEIQKTSRKIKHQIHNQMAVKKRGSMGILKGADKLESEGIKLQ